MKRRLLVTGLTLGVATWVLAPVVGLALLTWQQTDSTLLPAHATTVAVRANDVPTSSPVSIFVQRQPPRVLVAPQLTGIVEEAFISPGQSVENGDEVARIGGVVLRAARTQRPFTRMLLPGDRGADVVMLNEFLRDLGYRSRPSDVYSSSTHEGVRQYAKDIGIAGAAPGFDPNWVVYLAPGNFRVASVSMTVGAPAPAAGEPLATSAPEIGSALITSAAFEAQGDAESQEDGVRSSPPALVVSDNARVYVGPTELALATERDRLAPEALPSLAAYLSDDSSVVEARMEEPPMPGSLLIPPRAIYTDSEGRTCVIPAGGEDEPVEVAIVGSAFDATIVKGDVDVGTQVVVGASAEGLRCG